MLSLSTCDSVGSIDVGGCRGGGTTPATLPDASPLLLWLGPGADVGWVLTSGTEPEALGLGREAGVIMEWLLARRQAEKFS